MGSDDLIDPIESGEVFQYGSLKHQEVGIVRSAKNPLLQGAVDHVARAGGEFRVLSIMDERTGKVARGTGYTHYDRAKHIPYIAVAPNDTWDGVVHELTHFDDLLEAKKKLLDAGITGEKLDEKMNRIWSQDLLFHQKTEKRAIARQFQALAAKSKIQGRPNRDAVSPGTATIALPKFAEKLDYFISNAVYPEMMPILRFLEQTRPNSDRMPDPTEVFPFVDEAIRKAVAIKRAAYRRAMARIAKLEATQSDLTELDDLRSFARSQLDLTKLPDQMAGLQIVWFVQAGVEEPFRELVRKRLKMAAFKMKTSKPDDLYQPNVE